MRNAAPVLTVLYAPLYVLMLDVPTERVAMSTEKMGCEGAGGFRKIECPIRAVAGLLAAWIGAIACGNSLKSLSLPQEVEQGVIQRWRDNRCVSVPLINLGRPFQAVVRYLAKRAHKALEVASHIFIEIDTAIDLP